jgi:hypothetical protein
MFDYIVTARDTDNGKIVEHVSAVNPRHAAAIVHMYQMVPAVNTYQVKPVAGLGISTETLNDMQAYLQTERHG